MPVQTAQKTSPAVHRESETERHERLRREVQKIIDARNNREITEDEALARIASLRRRSNGFMASVFHRHY